MQPKALLNLTFFLGIIGLSLINGHPLFALEKPENDLSRVGITTVLGQQIDLGTTFTDETGKASTLKELVGENRPFIIVPAYYGCPRLCGLVLNGVTQLLSRLDLRLGSDYRVLTVSFNPEETVQDAATRAKHYRDLLLGKTEEEKANWHFLVGQEPSIRALMGQIGFNYEKDKDDFAHSAAIMILTPGGKISQYFTGIDFPTRDLRLALVDASQGSIGSAIDRIFLFCFRYDHIQGKYTLAAFNVMRAGGLLSLGVLTGLIFLLRRREKIFSGKAPKAERI